MRMKESVGLAEDVVESAVHSKSNAAHAHEWVSRIDLL